MRIDYCWDYFLWTPFIFYTWNAELELMGIHITGIWVSISKVGSKKGFELLLSVDSLH